MAEYTVKGGNVFRHYREFGYSNVHGGKNPDPTSARQENLNKEGNKGE